MELPEPKSKKHCRLPKNLPLPIVLKKDGNIRKFAATFNGVSVVISDPEEMKIIISMGYFGKASFSRSYPQFTRDYQTKIIRRRQFTNRKTCCNKFPDKTKPDKVIVVPDSDSDNEDYFTNLQPAYEIDHSNIKENVWLGLEEAFFLVSAVKCLNIHYKDKILEADELWMIFQGTDPNFVRNYVVYYYYRGKNWVVKPGIKFGGDFMLYKEGPPFYHATYIVIIDVFDEDGERNLLLTNRPMDNVSIMALNRLCESAGKELLICRIKWSKNTKISYQDLTNLEIQEVLVGRWIPSQEREHPQ